MHIHLKMPRLCLEQLVRRSKGGSSDPLQIDGDALSCRQVVRFDSNTPHDDSHSLVHLSLRSLASADRQGCSSSSTRAPQIWLKADRAREALFTPSRGRKMSCLRGSNLVFHLTTSIESDLISCSDHPDSHFSKPPPVRRGRQSRPVCPRTGRRQRTCSAARPPWRARRI